MTTIYAGALLDRPPGPKYVEALEFAELAFETSLPKAATLGKWRAQAPEGFRVAIVVPRRGRIGSANDELDEVLAWLKEAADALKAFALVLPTGPELTTSTRDKDRLRAHVDRLSALSELVVWSPGGLWDSDSALPFAAKASIHCAFDPLADEAAPATEPAYCRLKAIGGRQRFSEGLLYEIVSTLEDAEYEAAYVALESPRSFREASALQQLTE